MFLHYMYIYKKMCKCQHVYISIYTCILKYIYSGLCTRERSPPAPKKQANELGFRVRGVVSKLDMSLDSSHENLVRSVEARAAETRKLDARP